VTNWIKILKPGAKIAAEAGVILALLYLYVNAFLSGAGLCGYILMGITAAAIGRVLGYFIGSLFRSGGELAQLVGSVFGGGLGALSIGGMSLYWLGQEAESYVGTGDPIFQRVALIGCICCCIVGSFASGLIYLLPFNSSKSRAAAIGSAVGSIIPYGFFASLIHTFASFSNL
jgi:hypothetical protein